MSEVALIVTGFILGVVHVLTGPDHLSALATLAANHDDVRLAFSLGIRWGVGHSMGLLIVGSVLISLSSTAADTVEVPETVSRICEGMVGVFMLLLGTYGLVRAMRKRQSDGHSSHDHYHLEQHEPLQQSKNEASISMADMVDLEKMEKLSDLDSEKEEVGDEETEEKEERMNLSIDGIEQEEPSSDSMRPSFLSRIVSKVSVRTMAVLVGIVHGIAGPGGVLGVIPAVQLRDWWYGSVYLLTFCGTSTLVMGCFAATYGTCTSRIGKGGLGEFRIECLSSIMSIVVGVLWIVLVSLNKLDEIFPGSVDYVMWCCAAGKL